MNFGHVVVFCCWRSLSQNHRFFCVARILFFTTTLTPGLCPRYEPFSLEAHLAEWARLSLLGRDEHFVRDSQVVFSMHLDPRRKIVDHKVEAIYLFLYDHQSFGYRMVAFEP